MAVVIEPMAVCPQWASNWEVEGSNGNNYLVQFHRAEPASCSCPAYKYSGEYGEQKCKHIEKVREHGCFYHPQSGWIGANDWDDSPEAGGFDHGLKLLSTAADSTTVRCVGCGAPALYVRIAV